MRWITSTRPADERAVEVLEVVGRHEEQPLLAGRDAVERVEQPREGHV